MYFIELLPTINWHFLLCDKALRINNSSEIFCQESEKREWKIENERVKYVLSPYPACVIVLNILENCNIFLNLCGLAIKLFIPTTDTYNFYFYRNIACVRRALNERVMETTIWIGQKVK